MFFLGSNIHVVVTRLVRFIKITWLFPGRKLLNDLVGHLLCVRRFGSSFFICLNLEEGKKPIMLLPLTHIYLALEVGKVIREA